MKSPKKKKIAALSTLVSQDAGDDVFITNYTLIRLTLHGLSTKGLCRHTKLTPGQVSSRIRLYGLQGVRKSFRDGATPESQTVCNLAMAVPGEARLEEGKKFTAIRGKVIAEIKAARNAPKKKKTGKK
jgi:hypothetical protein